MSQRFQFRLRAFVVLCLFIGASAGLTIRWWLTRPHYALIGLQIEQFNVWGMWARRGGKEELLYLLVFPNRGGSTGIEMQSEGIFVNGTNVLKKQPSRYWVYTDSSGQGNVRPIEVNYNLKRDDWLKLRQTTLWSEHLRPAIVLESERVRIGISSPRHQAPRRVRRAKRGEAWWEVLSLDGTTADAWFGVQPTYPTMIR